MAAAASLLVVVAVAVAVAMVVVVVAQLLRWYPHAVRLEAHQPVPLPAQVPSSSLRATTSSVERAHRI